MSTRRTRPAAAAAGGSRRHGLGGAEGDGDVGADVRRRCLAGVRVDAARQVDGHHRDAAPGPPRPGAGAGSRSPAPAPRPTMPSTTRSAPATAAVAAGTRPPPSRRPAAAGRAQRGEPVGVRARESRTAVTRAPRRASRAPAHSASPPLLPPPTSRTTRRPVTPPACARSTAGAHGGQRRGGPLHQRARAAPRRSRPSSAARTSATRWATSPSHAVRARPPDGTAERASCVTRATLAQPRTSRATDSARAGRARRTHDEPALARSPRPPRVDGAASSLRARSAERHVAGLRRIHAEPRRSPRWWRRAGARTGRTTNDDDEVGYAVVRARRRPACRLRPVRRGDRPRTTGRASIDVFLDPGVHGQRLRPRGGRASWPRTSSTTAATTGHDRPGGGQRHGDRLLRERRASGRSA